MTSRDVRQKKLGQSSSQVNCGGRARVCSNRETRSGFVACDDAMWTWQLMSALLEYRKTRNQVSAYALYDVGFCVYMPDLSQKPKNKLSLPNTIL